MGGADAVLVPFGIRLSLCARSCPSLSLCSFVSVSISLCSFDVTLSLSPVGRSVPLCHVLSVFTSLFAFVRCSARSLSADCRDMHSPRATKERRRFKVYNRAFRCSTRFHYVAHAYLLRLCAFFKRESAGSCSSAGQTLSDIDSEDRPWRPTDPNRTDSTDIRFPSSINHKKKPCFTLCSLLLITQHHLDMC